MALPGNRNVLRDEIIKLKGFYAKQGCTYLLRRIEVWDKETGDTIVLLTNHLSFGSTTVAAIHKDR